MSYEDIGHESQKKINSRPENVLEKVWWCVGLLAGEEPHHVPVSGKDAQLHQVAEHTEDLEQELLGEGAQTHGVWLPSRLR